MRVSTLVLSTCCIYGLSLAAVLPSSHDATLNPVRSVNEQQEPKPDIVQRQPAAASDSATPPPPNAKIPPSQSNALVDGKPVTKRSATQQQEPKPDIVQRQPAAASNSAAPPPPIAKTPPPPNAKIPPSQSNALVDGKPVTKRSVTQQRQGGLQARQLELFAATAVANPAGAVVVVLVLSTLLIAGSAVERAQSFNEAREIFTFQQPDEMWKRNPDYAKFPAAACYGLGYRLANPTGLDGLIHVNVTGGVFQHENYDCMYITGPNQFFTDSDGGSLNLGVTYDPTRCSFDKKTADLTCT